MNLVALTFSVLLSMSSIVGEFHLLDDRQEENAFIKRHQDNNSADLQAYVCALRMKKAKYARNPYNKLKIFYKQRDVLEGLLIKHPDNIHLRYIRLLIQEATPGFLGYKQHIEDDKAFLQIKLDTKDTTDYMDQYIKKNTSL